MNQTSNVPYTPSQPDTHHGGGGGGGGGGHGGTNNNGDNNSNSSDDNETEEPPQDNETEQPSENHTTNYVSVFPEQTNASLGHLFSVAILCEPVQFIKSWEMTLDYDPAYLYADSVLQGNFFDGFPIFYSPNIIIDNVNGTITRLYALTIGPGLMTNNTGILSIIQFTTLKLGNTHLNIAMIGLTNDTQYIPVITNNCTIAIS